jgi:long-chain acyl-CoA synthetase
MLTHANCVAEVTSARMHGVELTKDDVYISYLPLAHIFERVVSAIVLSYGAAGGFYQGDVLKLFDDIQLLRPTLFPSVPRLFNRLFDKVNSTIATTGGLKKFLYEWGYATKKSQLDYGQDPANRFWDSLVFSNLRAKLGGRVRYIITGSAPISEQVFQFLQICFGCPVLQGYGLTETTAACNISAINDWKCGHVGPPTVSVEEKLEDVPEMNYFTANPRGPPQGEICVRGPSVFVGYYKDEEKTREAIDKDGWFHTGDIGQWNPDGTLTIIDRKKNIFKLAQGEYVAAEYLEQVYVKAPLVAQIFVYGDSLQAVLVAVVVPDAEVLLPWARSQGLKGDLEALCREEAVRKAVLAELTQVGKDAKLKGFEFVKAIHLDHRPFSVENGLLTPTFKNKRADLKKHYQAEIDAMYAALKAAEKKE